MKKTLPPLTAPVLRNMPLQSEAHVLAFSLPTPMTAPMPTPAVVVAPAQPTMHQRSPAQAVDLARSAALKSLVREPVSQATQALTSATPAPTAPSPETALAPTPASSIETLAEQRYQEGLRAGREHGAEAGYAKAQEEVKARLAAAEEDLAKRTAAAKKALAELQAATGRLDKLAASLQHRAAEQLQLAEEDQLALCFDVVARVLGETAAKPEALLALVRETALQMRQRPLTAVHVHPDDLELLKQLPEGMARLEAQWQPAGSAPDESVSPRGLPSGVAWIPDPEVRLGGCIVASPEGGLDARLEVLLQSLRKSLTHMRAERAAAPLVAEKGDAP